MYTGDKRGGGWFWGLVLLALMLAGGAFLVNGVVGFVQTGGDIAAPLAATFTPATATPTDEEIAPFNFVFASPSPMPACIEFYVTVVRARVRECPSEDCETLERPYENALICVWGVASNAPEWYEVNLDPDEPLPRIGYMHESVIYPRRPTPRPTATLRPTATPRFRLTATLTPTYALPPTVTPVPGS